MIDFGQRRYALIPLLLTVLAPAVSATPHTVVVSNAYGNSHILRPGRGFIAGQAATNLDGVDHTRWADVDGDGDPDIVSAAYRADDVSWWENVDGSGTNWSRHTVSNGVDGVRSVYVADVNGDNNPDVIGASYGADDVLWWQNMDGSGLQWRAHTVDFNFNGARAVCAEDLDADGDVDIIAAAYLDDLVSWWENIGGDGTNWTRHPLDDDAPGARDVCAADLDGDSDPDIIIAASSAGTVHWWENLDGHAGSWTRHVVDTNFAGAKTVVVGDLDGDMIPDLLGAAFSDNTVAWWRNSGAGVTWTRHPVGAAFTGALSAEAADLDSDGDLDVLGAASGSGNMVVWWENLGGGTNWGLHELANPVSGARSATAADVDLDTDVDVCAAAYITDDIPVWINDINEFTEFSPPVDTNSFETASNVMLRVPVTPLVIGATQHTCIGWSATGSAPPAGQGSVTERFELTNATSLAWEWQLDYRLNVAIEGEGSVTGAGDWIEPNSNVTLVAAPATYFHFDQWDGATNNTTIDSNELSFLMQAPRDVVARFGPDLAAQGTPLWWLAIHGVTETNDSDTDGHEAWAEWIAGTVPTNGESVFRAVGATSQSNAGFVLSWAGVSGRTYSIDWAPAPTGTYRALTSGLPATPTLNVYTDATLGADARFYSFEVQLIAD